MIRHTSARCLLLILLWPATGSAQTGSIRGSVVDQTDLVLPGATVTLRGNGVPRTAYSDGPIVRISVEALRQRAFALCE